MMMMTMKAPEAPSPTTNSIAADKVCDPMTAVDTKSCTISCTAGSCNSLTSSCSNSTSSTIASNFSKLKKRVSFSLKQTEYFSPEQILSKEERKSDCWYSEKELNVSRDEARKAIQAMHHQLQLDAAAAAKIITTNVKASGTPAVPVSDGYGSWVLRSPEDQTKIVCLRGIEKYADAAAKYAGQKRLVNSVLQQQNLNNEVVQVSMVSQTLSKPFKEVAQYYAMKSAEELDLSRKLEVEQEERERRQREEVATVLLLIMGQENDRKQREQQQTLPKTSSQIPSSILQDAGLFASPRGSISGKRSSYTNSPLCESRNVKPCIHSISDRMRGL